MRSKLARQSSRTAAFVGVAGIMLVSAGCVFLVIKAIRLLFFILFFGG